MDTGLIMVFAGRFLQDDGYETISEIDLQKYIKDSDEIGYNIPLPEIRKALDYLNTGGFLELFTETNGKKIYTYRNGKPFKKEEEKVFAPQTIGNTLPLYANGLGIIA